MKVKREKWQIRGYSRGRTQVDDHMTTGVLATSFRNFESIYVILTMGYSRKNPHTPDRWQDFLIPPCARVAETVTPPSHPDFQGLPCKLPLIFGGHNFNNIINSQWKRRKIAFRRSFFVIFQNFGEYWHISTFSNNYKQVSFLCRVNLLLSINATCLFSTPHQIHRMRNTVHKFKYF